MRFPRSDKRKCHRKCFYPVEHKQLIDYILKFGSSAGFSRVMCAVFSKLNPSFRWTAYLVFVIGVCTILHWFLAVPLVYSHLYECCNENLGENWIAWFLGISLACWLVVSISIVVIWVCLRVCRARHLNESNVRLTGKPGADPEGDKTENNSADLLKSSEAIRESAKEVIALPDFRPADSMAVLKVNDQQSGETPVSRLDCPIPVDESRHYVQSEGSPEKDVSETPLKTPREIFFKDLIEAASKSYFDFDPEKISRDLKKKYDDDLEKVKEDEGKPSEESNFFVGPHSRRENLKSEVVINLNEKGLVVEEPVVLGQFQILKE